MPTTTENWPLRLFRRSVIKQRKYRMITRLLGSTRELHCLDIGADNGVMSYLLRRRGGTWKSADLDENAVRSIRELVKTGVYRIDGKSTPFEDEEFDTVVIVDFLEHIHSDHEFVEELFRIIKPGGTLLVNVPHVKNGPLRKFRLAIGQTDEKHGHVRPGYTIESLESLLGPRFTVEIGMTYSRSFSELIDTLIVGAVYLLKSHKKGDSSKGAIVTGKDLENYRTMFRVYTLIYPVVWFFSKLDSLLFFTSGYMLIARARINKPVSSFKFRGPGYLTPAQNPQFVIRNS